jgi:hypothetical protein
LIPEWQAPKARRIFHRLYEADRGQTALKRVPTR